MIVQYVHIPQVYNDSQCGLSKCPVKLQQLEIVIMRESTKVWSTVSIYWHWFTVVAMRASVSRYFCNLVCQWLLSDVGNCFLIVNSLTAASNYPGEQLLASNCPHTLLSSKKLPFCWPYLPGYDPQLFCASECPVWM